MRGVVVVALALVLSTAASGCFVSKDDPETTGDAAGALSSDGSASGSRSGTGSTGKSGSSGTTSGTTAGTGSPPAITNFTANATGLEVAFAATATDGDNGTLSWSIAFGDNSSANGTMVAVAGVHVASANATYAEAGTYTAVLTVSDGGSAVNLTLSVTVEAAGGPPATPMAPVTMSGSCTMPATTSHTVDVLAGQAFIHGVISPGPTGIDVDWAIADPSGSEKDAGGDFDPIDGGEGDLDVDAPAAGTWTVSVTCFLGAAASYDFTLTFN